MAGASTSAGPNPTPTVYFVGTLDQRRQLQAALDAQDYALKAVQNAISSGILHGDELQQGVRDLQLATSELRGVARAVGLYR